MPNNTLKVGLKTTDKDGQEVWLNGIVEKEAMTFEVGQEVELEVEQTQYGLQFKAPTLASLINALDNRLRKVEMIVGNNVENAPQSQNEPLPTTPEPNEIKVEDIPF
jgi:ribosomal 50S subunit-recycling heat shock protein